MPRDLTQASIFVDQSEYAIQRFFDVINVGRSAMERLAEQINHLQRLEEREHDWWMNDGQWEGGNQEFAQYMNRVRLFSRRREELLQGSARTETIANLLAESGATELSVAIAAGAVLQVAKQILSFRFGGAAALPVAGARRVGSQSIVTVIWEGRNHSMHWEEPERPRKVSEWRKVFVNLERDFGLRFREAENMSFEVLMALGWTSPDQVLEELRALIQLDTA